MKKITLSLICATFLGCSSSFKLHDVIEQLSIALEFSDEVDQESAEVFIGLIDEVLNEYKGTLIFSAYDSNSVNVLKVKIGKTKIAGTKERVTALVVSTIGIALPVYLISQKSSFVIGFVHLPFTTTKVNFQFSDHLENADSQIRKNISTLSFSGSRKYQLVRQKNKIKGQIFAILKQIEKHNNSISN